MQKRKSVIQTLQKQNADLNSNCQTKNLSLVKTEACLFC